MGYQFAGPSIIDIATLLQASDNSHKDQSDFYKAQIIFWLIGATDGHAKNFSIFLAPGGGFKLTPFYDVLSAQQAFDQKQIPRKSYKLAMSVGKSHKYKIHDITERHFVETGEAAGLVPAVIREAISSILEVASSANDATLEKMPDDFSVSIHESIEKAMKARLKQLETALELI